MSNRITLMGYIYSDVISFDGMRHRISSMEMSELGFQYFSFFFSPGGIKNGECD